MFLLEEEPSFNFMNRRFRAANTWIRLEIFLEENLSFMPGMNTKNAAISETLNSFSRSSVLLQSWFPFLANFSVTLYQALTTTLLIFC